MEGLLRSARHPTQADTPLPAADEREDRAIPPHARGRLGLCQVLRFRGRTTPGAARLAPLLQPPPTPLCDWRRTLRPTQQRPWTSHLVKGEPVAVPVDRAINAYLVDGPNLLVKKRTTVISPQLGIVNRGTQPTDGGHLIVEVEDYAEVAADAVAAKYLRPFRGAREFLHGVERWCLWLEDLDPADLKNSPVLRHRIESCRVFRENSSKTGDAYKLRNIPHLFRPNSKRPKTGSVAKIVKLEHAWRRLDGRNDDGFQVAPFPG